MKTTIKYYYFTCRSLSSFRKVPRMDAFQKHKSLGSMIESSVTRLNGSLSRKRGKELIGILKRYLHGVLGRLTFSDVKLICTFVFLLVKLVKFEGMKGTVMYLKSCHILTMQAIGQYYIPDSTLLKRRVRRRRNGLPFVIPVLQARLLKRGDPLRIRFWLTLFSFYRILSFPYGKVDLSTITSPGKDFDLSQFEEFSKVFYKHFSIRMERFKEILSEVVIFPILSSGPLSAGRFEGEHKELVAATSSHYRMAAYTAFNLKRARNRIFSVMRKYAGLGDRYEELVDRIGDSARSQIKWGKQWSPRAFWPTTIGKLSLKFEAAGKIRVFAMVDCWTQWIMYPLHKAVFHLLSFISQDGTFDQMAPSRLLMLKLIGRKRYPQVSSLDLSAATDRLPLSLQKLILSPFIGEEYAEYWATILVGREYSLFTKSTLPQWDGVETRFEGHYRYAVGQPMGARSSWALLALTHHFIVQYCHWLVCKSRGKPYSWFKLYSVLGDDIVIADAKVSRVYREKMAELGVGLGLAKSIISRRNPPVMEFAKKFMVGGMNCSGVSFRDIITATISTSAASSFILRSTWTLNSYLTLRGLGYRAKSRWNTDLWACSSRLRTYLVHLRSPGQAFEFSILDWLTMRSYERVYSHEAVDWEAVYDVLWEHYLLLIDRLVEFQELMVTPYTIKGGWESYPEIFSPISPLDIKTPADIRYWVTYSTLAGHPRDKVRWLGKSFYWSRINGMPSFEDCLSKISLGETKILRSVPYKGMVMQDLKFPVPLFLLRDKERFIDQVCLTTPLASKYWAKVKVFTGLDEGPAPIGAWGLVIETLFKRIVTLSNDMIFPRDDPVNPYRRDEMTYSSFLPYYKLWVKVNKVVRRSYLLRRGRYRPNAGLELWFKDKPALFSPYGPRCEKRYFTSKAPFPLLVVRIGWIWKWPIIGFFSACLIELFYDFVVVSDVNEDESLILPYWLIWSITGAVVFLILLLGLSNGDNTVSTVDPHLIPLITVTGEEVPDPTGFVRRTSRPTVPFSPILN